MNRTLIAAAATLLATALTASLPAAPALACGADSDCIVAGERTYRIALPEGHDGASPVGAVVFAHGYRGSAAGIMRNGSLRRMLSGMNLALIALKSGDDDWHLPNAPRKPDATAEAEVAYVEAVLADAAARFPVDTSRLMATGFSAGGMLTWTLACEMPGSFAAFAPIAGTFWKTPPETCKGMASVLHIHGTQDTTVPLAGRRIADTVQGDVTEVLAMYRAYGGFSGPETRRAGDLDCTAETAPDGHMLEVCLFPGGHSFRSEFVKFAWERFEAIGAL